MNKEIECPCKSEKTLDEDCAYHNPDLVELRESLTRLGLS